MERAIVKEITNLVARGTWADLETVQEWTDVAATNPEASVVAAHIILSIKHYELDESCWVFKARLVAGGNRHFSVDGVVIFEEDLFAVPADLDGARIVLSHAVLEQNGEVLQSDVDQAFTQAPLKNDNIFICLPKKLWPDSWKLMRKPVVRLRKALYGLRRSGFDYADFSHNIIIKHGWSKIRDYAACLYCKRVKGMLLWLTIYVDDLLASGSHLHVKPELNMIAKDLVMSAPAPVSLFLGIHCKIIRHNPFSADITQQQQMYTIMLISRFFDDRSLSKNHRFRKVYTPAVDFDAPSDELAHPGLLKAVAPKHVGGLLFLMRCSRPDIAVALGILSRHVTTWTLQDDQFLERLFAYLSHTLDAVLLMTGNAVDPSRNFIRCRVDSDHGGCPDSLKSTSGACTQIISASGTNCTLGWRSKRQTVAAPSTAHAEVIAYADGLKHQVLPIAGTYEDAGVEMVTESETDSSAAYGAIIAGYSKSMRYMKKVNKVGIAFCHDAVEANDDLRISEVRSGENTSDILTKPLPRGAHWKHSHELGIRCALGAEVIKMSGNLLNCF
jgi:hypothetical protein